MIARPATFSCKIDIKLKDRLKQDLEEQGFEFSTPAYTIFSAKKKNLTVVLYQSGALLVQGKAKDEFIEFYLEPEILQSFTYTNPEMNVSMVARIGSDEAGKGDFFGPLCVASLYADEPGIKKLISLNVRDSKKMSDKSVLDMADKIKGNFQLSLLRIFPEKYNELYIKFKNLNTLLAWAHSTAIAQLFEKTSCKNVLVDKFANEAVLSSAIKRKNIEINLEQKTHAESDVVVAGASIIARAAFLKGLEELSDQYKIKLLKGASSAVIDLGKEFVKIHGSENLEKVAKIHFKTNEQIISTND